MRRKVHQDALRFFSRLALEDMPNQTYRSGLESACGARSSGCYRAWVREGDPRLLRETTQPRLSSLTSSAAMAMTRTNRIASGDRVRRGRTLALSELKGTRHAKRGAPQDRQAPQERKGSGRGAVARSRAARSPQVGALGWAERRAHARTSH